MTPAGATLEGDREFHSVNMKDDRTTLAPGTLALSQNARLRTKRAAQRPGTVAPVHFNIVDVGGAIRGAGVYSNPNGDEVLLVATANNKIYAMRDGSYPQEIGLAAGETFPGEVEFVQAFDKVLLFRGLEQRPLVWDGVSSAGFAEITKKNPADTSTVIIPNAVTAEPFMNRILIISGNDEALVSDTGDYTSYDKILDSFRINAGTSDTIVRLFGYVLGAVIVFKGRSIMSMSNFTSDPNQVNFSVINGQLGLAAGKAVAWDGPDALFLSKPGGIFRLGQVIENRTQTAPVPVSDNIQPLIDRINWAAAHTSVTAGVGEYIFFAVPVDGATRPNTMIVYNSATQRIEGYDTWAEPFRMDELKVTLWQGTRRLYAIDKVLGRIYVLYEGLSDFIYPDAEAEAEVAVEEEIAFRIETRGYATITGSGETKKAFKRTEIHTRTWAPSLRVTELTEGAGDERPLHLTPITKSRTKNDRFGKKDWDPTNVNDDWDEPGRQDYSIVADETGFDPGTNGLDPERKQYHPLRFNLRTRAAYVSYRVENDAGSCEVLAVGPVVSQGVEEPRRAA